MYNPINFVYISFLILCLDPTLTLSNLTTLLENVAWDDMGHVLWIPASKLNMIQQQHHESQSQCRQAFLELYLNEAPFPCWKRVAKALYLYGHLEELEIVQKKYLKGASAIPSSQQMSVGCYGDHCPFLTALINPRCMCCKVMVLGLCVMCMSV